LEILLVGFEFAHGFTLFSLDGFIVSFRAFKIKLEDGNFEISHDNGKKQKRIPRGAEIRY
jgi:hypothetical protein